MNKQTRPEESPLDSCQVATGNSREIIARNLLPGEPRQPPGDKKCTAEPAVLQRDMVLSHKDAEAASPADVAACGEEDPGSAVEVLVTTDKH